ncbi:hypothetical protein K505DRAFT_58441 [Melanomma pulvis-pyrius CBS 109.77]|uniref:Uncharacterized protein n=1 Tax=Melanomma pulvis-pyrius CBS 109.77 TaxID=1314802 RepID=A0A6A6XT09_9PLEO|nr:hypothetical protein K505DRAFT_58441 [Melanomma pulvis-pyrius CBS 109.77]
MPSLRIPTSSGSGAGGSRLGGILTKRRRRRSTVIEGMRGDWLLGEYCDGGVVERCSVAQGVRGRWKRRVNHEPMGHGRETARGELVSSRAGDGESRLQLAVNAAGNSGCACCGKWELLHVAWHGQSVVETGDRSITSVSHYKHFGRAEELACQNHSNM